MLINSYVDTFRLWGLELILISLAVILAFAAPGLGRRLSRPIRGMADGLVHRPLLATIMIATFGFLSTAAVSLLVRFPEPWVCDEFSYLLAADTFASGRLTNPTHPLWPHFETLQVIQQPSYSSKYPPGQGLILAVGQLLGGHPIVGVWLSAGLLCASLFWMLRGWLPPRWALLGGALSVLHFGFFAYWNQHYWGGSVAAAGGALLFGALRRMARGPRLAYGLTLAAGLALLANTRPFEGLIVSVPAAVILLCWMARRCSAPPRRELTRSLVAAGGLLLLTGAAMVYYNCRTTGQALRPPYLVHEETYSPVMPFLWSSASEDTPVYRHDVMRDFHTWALEEWRIRRSLVGFLSRRTVELGGFVAVFLRMVFILPLILFLGWHKGNWSRLALITILLLTLVSLATTWTTSRKLAPITCLLVYGIVWGLRALHGWRWKRKPVGRCLATWAPLIVLTSTLAGFLPTMQQPGRWGAIERSELLRRLERDGQRHLVIVRYVKTHRIPHFEWVYNRADIDAAQVVWAREMDAASNEKLLRHFDDRRSWLLLGDVRPARLLPYPATE